MDPKILIVGTTPYHRAAASRAFDSYFHGWDPDCLAQIFSNPNTPAPGHCGTLYQITDRMLLRRWFRRDAETGRVFHAGELTGEPAQLGGTVRRLYRWGSRKNALVYLLRGLLWQEAFWHTPELDRWLEDFQPQCVFLSFSDDFFIPKIALYAAEKFDIPILSSIGDDYYFSYRASLSPLYHLYKLSYRALIRRIFAHKGSAVFIDDKIRDRYNSAFSLNGRTVHLASDQPRRPFRPIDTDAPVIAYFGNLRLGRNRTLNAIGLCLGQIDPRYVLDIYSNERDPAFFRLFGRNPNIRFHGAVPYEEVQRRMGGADILILAEGFGRRDVEAVRYSLSTKVADTLASGAAVFACGHRDSGAMDYCQRIGCVTACTDLSRLTDQLRELIFDPELQKRQYDAAASLLRSRHRLEHSTVTFRQTLKDLIDNG